MACRAFAAVLAFTSFEFVASMSMGCYSVVSNLQSGKHLSLGPVPVNCSLAQGDREEDVCFALCGLCTTPELAFALTETDMGLYCSGSYVIKPNEDALTIANLTTNALILSLQVQGYFLNDPDDVSEAVQFYIRYAPRRDLQFLFSSPYLFGDYLLEHARFTLATWQWASAMGIPQDIFLESVAPYAFVNEKRDVWWRWRPMLYNLFSPLVANATNTTTAMRRLAAAIPAAQVGPGAAYCIDAPVT